MPYLSTSHSVFVLQGAGLVSKGLLLPTYHLLTYSLLMSPSSLNHFKGNIWHLSRLQRKIHKTNHLLAWRRAKLKKTVKLGQQVSGTMSSSQRVLYLYLLVYKDFRLKLYQQLRNVIFFMQLYFH